MKKHFMSVAALTGIISLAACSSDDITAPADNNVQTIQIAVASTGDRATRSRQLYSEKPGQNIENVTIVIANKTTGKVVYTKTITDWNTDQVSTAYEGNGHGRKYELALTGADRLKAGDYTITAVGYTAADLATNDIASATVGGDKTTYTSTFDETKDVQETFAGESTVSLRENHAAINTSVTLHRQVAGYYGYFTSIPAKVNGTEVASVRLVARSKNTKLTYGNFNADFTTTGSDIKYVVNGSEAAATKGAKFNGSADDDAYTVYSIDIKDWFTAGDSNGDGILDEHDTWTNALSASGYKTYQEGTIFAGGFAVPFAGTDAATLELQLLASDGTILKAWTVNMDQAQNTGEDVTGTALTNTESVTNFSFFRNHMYTLGKKFKNTDTPEPTNPDEPEPLDKTQSITLRVNDNWEVINHMNIGD